MAGLVPASGSGVSARPIPVRSGLERRTERALSVFEQSAVLEMAAVQATAMVQGVKLEEVDRLTRSAMAGQAMLSQWAATLAQGDPFISDELKFFTDVARLGKGEVIASTVESFAREGR